MLFWFGVFAQLLIINETILRYQNTGEFFYLFPDNILANIWNISYKFFGHFVHIAAAFWLSKGKIHGAILGLAISLYEIIPFLIPPFIPNFLTVQGIGIRVLFGIIIMLIVLGWKDLPKLQMSNWRPWKNPKTPTIKQF